MPIPPQLLTSKYLSLTKFIIAQHFLNCKYFFNFFNFFVFFNFKKNNDFFRSKFQAVTPSSTTLCKCKKRHIFLSVSQEQILSIPCKYLTFAAIKIDKNIRHFPFSCIFSLTLTNYSSVV